jgi:uncharacterized membrane protein
MASDLDRYALPMSPHASRRLLLAVGLAVLLAWGLPGWLGAAGRTILSWDAAALLLLGLSWAHILKSTPEETRRRAALNDPGRTSLRALVVFCSAFSMVVANVFAKNAKTLAPQAPAVLVWGSLSAVALSWLLTHTSYALRYAHLYYRDADTDADAEEGPPGGLEFPHGVAPCELDFAYFSFTVGMTFQVSDVIVTSTPMRHTVLAQAVLAFAYNTAVLAFCLQLIFGAL